MPDTTTPRPRSFLDVAALPVAGVFFVTSMPCFIAVLSWARGKPGPPFTIADNWQDNEVAWAAIGTTCIAMTGLAGIVLGSLAMRPTRDDVTRTRGSLARVLGLATAAGIPVLLFVLLWLLGWDLHLDLHIVG